MFELGLTAPHVLELAVKGNYSSPQQGLFTLLSDWIEKQQQAGLRPFRGSIIHLDSSFRGDYEQGLSYTIFCF